MMTTTGGRKNVGFSSSNGGLLFLRCLLDLFPMELDLLPPLMNIRGSFCLRTRDYADCYSDIATRFPSDGISFSNVNSCFLGERIFKSGALREMKGNK